MSKGGSKPGERRGGRQRGARNKATLAVLAIEAEVAASGETPREYMLRVMRDPTAEAVRRDAMAKAAAPYVHPTFASIRHSGDSENPVKVERIERVIISAADRDRRGIPAAS
jgi:hypothetical protein